MGLLLHVEPFRQFSLLLPMFPFVNGCDIALLFHDLSTARVDFRGECDSFHSEAQFSFDALLDATLLLLLPLRHGLQELGPKGVFLVGLFASGLLSDGLVLLHPVHASRGVVGASRGVIVHASRGVIVGALLLFHFGFEAQLNGLLALLDGSSLKVACCFGHGPHLTLSPRLVALTALLQTLAFETASGILFLDEGQCDFQFHAQLRVVVRGMNMVSMGEWVLIFLYILGEVVVVVGLAPIHVELPGTLHPHHHCLTLSQILLQDEGLGLDFGHGGINPPQREGDEV